MNTVTIHHLRPGKPEEIFNEGFVSDNHNSLVTSTQLTKEQTRSFSERLISRGFIQPDERIHFVEKFYSYNESFNLLVFRDLNRKVLGYYSDIAMPITKVDDGYEIVDLFLDIWLKPDGTLLELDLDEFQDAISKGLITEEQQTLAVTTFERLKEEAKQGIYPQNLYPTKIAFTKLHATT